MLGRCFQTKTQTPASAPSPTIVETMPIAVGAAPTRFHEPEPSSTFGSPATRSRDAPTLSIWSGRSNWRCRLEATPPGASTAKGIVTRNTVANENRACSPYATSVAFAIDEREERRDERGA